MQTAGPIEVLLWSHERDQRFLRSFRVHLGVLEQSGHIRLWHRDAIPPGADRDVEFARALLRASWAVLLVSPDLLAAEQKLLSAILERRGAGRVQIVPIMVRPIQLYETELKGLQVLPRSGRPVTLWPNQDAAWSEIVEEFRRTLPSWGAPSSDAELLGRLRQLAAGTAGQLDVSLEVLPADRTSRNIRIQPAWSARVLRVGDLLELRLRSAEDCYLQLFDIGSSGHVTRLLPGVLSPTRFLRGGEELRLPPADGAYRIELAGPPGQETFCVVAHSSPWPIAGIRVGLAEVTIHIAGA